MKNLAPEITRQRLLIEGRYTIAVARKEVETYLLDLASHLGLRSYGDPVVHSPQGTGKDENEGFDAFIPLIDSGISLYVWSSASFFSAVLFTCKEFDIGRAVEFTREFFATTDIEHRSF